MPPAADATKANSCVDLRECGFRTHNLCSERAACGARRPTGMSDDRCRRRWIALATAGRRPAGAPDGVSARSPGQAQGQSHRRCRRRRSARRDDASVAPLRGAERARLPGTREPLARHRHGRGCSAQRRRPGEIPTRPEPTASGHLRRRRHPFGPGGRAGRREAGPAIVGSAPHPVAGVRSRDVARRQAIGSADEGQSQSAPTGLLAAIGGDSAGISACNPLNVGLSRESRFSRRAQVC